ncbi:MAG: sigma-70 family RNA polymerase sigma factor [Planctomycetes bacterium]|nr:sigma-70 family RNA polymerase sigma factor [Planctomycetota bacterium]
MAETHPTDPKRKLIAELVERYQEAALSYLAGRIGDPEAARDLCQSVVAAILESPKELSSLEHLRNYFFVALRNAAADLGRARGRSREVRLPEEDDLAGDPRSEPPEARLIAEEEVVAQRRRLAALEEAIRGLPEAERQLLRQRFWERRTFREIQESTGAPISTLKSREDAILRRLRKTLDAAEEMG